METKKKLYNELLSAYKVLHPLKPHFDAEKDISAVWVSLKGSKLFPANAREKIQEFKDKASGKKSALNRFWVSKTSSSYAVFCTLVLFLILQFCSKTFHHQGLQLLSFSRNRLQ